MKRTTRFLCLLVIAAIASVQFFCISPQTVSASASSGSSWVGSWSTSPIKLGVKLGSVRVCDFLNNTSLRSVIQCTVGGSQVRIKLSNKYGANNITINEVNIARTSDTKASAVVAGSCIPLTFSGKNTAVIPAGSYIYSDPVKMTVQALEFLSVSYYIKDFTYITTGGLYGATTYVETGNKIGNANFSSATPLLFTASSITYHTVPFLCNVDVVNPDAYSVVFFGDSTITNQAPYYLAEKLVDANVKNVGVLQQAIVANRLLYDGDGVSVIGNIYGEAAIDRFADDVVAQPGVKAVYIKIGINDIIHPRTKSMSGKAPLATTDEIITGYRNLINQAHAAGIKIYFFARTQWRGYTRNFGLNPGEDSDVVWSQEANDMSIVLNQWLRYSSGADGFIDMSALADPYDNTRLKAEYTTDCCHLTELGARVLVDAIPASNFGISSSSFGSIVKIYNNGLGGKRVMTPVNASTGAVTTTAATTAPATTKKPGTTAAPGTQNTTANNNQPGNTTTPIVTTNPSFVFQTVLVPIEPDTTVADNTQATDINLAPLDAVGNEPLVAPTPVETSMSAGTKAVVVILSLIGFAGISVLVFYFIKKKNSAA